MSRKAEPRVNDKVFYVKTGIEGKIWSIIPDDDPDDIVKADMARVVFEHEDETDDIIFIRVLDWNPKTKMWEYDP